MSGDFGPSVQGLFLRCREAHITDDAAPCVSAITS